MLKGIYKFYNDNGFVLTLQRKIFEIINKVFSRCLIGDKGFVWYNSRIEGLKYIKIGKNFIAGKNLWLAAISEYNNEKFNPIIIIKDNVNIGEFVHIGAVNYIEIGENVLLASKIYISDHNHGTYKGKEQSLPDTPPFYRRISRGKIIIEDNAWIGEGVVILPDTHVGRGAIIGANAVVTNDIPPYTIAVGNPAKPIKIFNFKMNRWDKYDG